MPSNKTKNISAAEVVSTMDNKGENRGNSTDTHSHNISAFSTQTKHKHAKFIADKLVNSPNSNKGKQLPRI